MNKLPIYPFTHLPIKPIMSIENPTLPATAGLAHFRHFSSLFTNLPIVAINNAGRPGLNRLYTKYYRLTTNWPSTLVERPLQIALFMQNKPNFQKSQMNVNPYNTTDYENKSDWTLGENKPNQTQSNPICWMLK